LHALFLVEKAKREQLAFRERLMRELHREFTR
jgi:hypothetical protein